MKQLTIFCSAMLILTTFAGSALADFTLNGTTSGDSYGAAITVQTTQTEFGDNASELNAAYAVADFNTGFLYLTLTGQVENNFNKLNIFIDSVAGGQNTIGPDTANGGVNPTNDGWATNYSGIGEGNMNGGAGFTFDSGFAADYMIIARNGFAGGDRFDLDFNTVGNDSVVVSETDIFGGSYTGVNANVGATGIGVGYDNSNTAGVLGGTGAADQAAAAAVQTGLEFFIPLAAIGNPGLGDTILISAHVNGSNHDFLSNQSLAGFAPPQGNPGGDGTGGFNGDIGLIDLNQFAGVQHFGVTVVPEPSSLGLLAMAGIGLLRVRRRR